MRNGLLFDKQRMHKRHPDATVCALITSYLWDLVELFTYHPPHNTAGGCKLLVKIQNWEN